MLTARVNPQTRMLTVTYPAFSKIKSESIPVRSYDEASAVLRSKQVKFIIAEIRSFIHMRRYVYEKGRVMYPERRRAIEHLQMIVDSYATGSLHRLSKQVTNARLSFATLMPIKESPALTHFNTHIVPIIKFCTDHYQAQA